MNRTRLIRQPGQPGTKRLVEQCGPKLVCVRYRYDAQRNIRLKTVELIIETAPWNPRARNARRALTDMVYVRIGFGEHELRERIKATGAIWRPRHKVWEVDWQTVRELGLQSRVVIEEGN